MMILRLLFFVAIFLAFSSKMFSQIIEPCPPNQMDLNKSGLAYFIHYDLNFGNVNYKYSDQASEIDVVIDWNSMFNPSQSFSNETLKELLVLSLLEQFRADPSKVPSCGAVPCQNSRVVNVYDRTKCTHWSSCRFELEREGLPVCCNSDFGASETYRINGKWFITALRLKECGTKCCKTVYRICSGQGVASPNNTLIVCSTPLKSEVAGSSCSGQGNPEPSCLHGGPQPCEGDCTK